MTKTRPGQSAPSRAAVRTKYAWAKIILLTSWSQLLSAAIQICFRHNFFEKLSSGPKNGKERRPSRFSTICAKNQALKLNIDKVTVIRVTQITLPGYPRLYSSTSL